MGALPLLRDAVFVGKVAADSARIWARAEGASHALEVELLLDEGVLPRTVARAPLRPPADLDRARPEDDARDHTRAFTIPNDIPELGPLLPDRAYLVRVHRKDGGLVGEARFHTPWSGLGPPVGRLAFGVASCHQPFDGGGHVRPASERMLEAAAAALREEDARFLLLVGDQIYADYPPPLSLYRPRYFRQVAPPGRASVTECSREEVRRLYQERHRNFFGVEAFARLQAACPSYPMLDDHDVRDNFGTDPEHASAGWRSIREGALDAFYDYQGSRVLESPGGPRRPSVFHYGFSYGPVAVFMADLRSQRVADDDAVHVFDDAQIADLVAFLAEHAEHPVLCVVVTVPIVHIDGWMAAAMGALAGKGSNAADRWSHPRMVQDRDRLLRILREHQRAHPSQRVVMLAGDIHVGSAFRLDWSDGGPPTYQFTSSALSHVQGRPKRWAAEVLPRTSRRVSLHDGLSAEVHLVKAANGAARNPYGGVNLGIVEIDWGAQLGVRFKLVGAEAGGARPVTVFESPLL